MKTSACRRFSGPSCGPLLLLAAVLAGCAAPVPPPPPMPQPVAMAPAQADPRLSVEAAARNFVTVVERVEPVAENACVALNGPGVDCDLQIVVVPDLEAPPNAFQTLDEAGRPEPAAQER